jgi:hypothetical protein
MEGVRLIIIAVDIFIIIVVIHHRASRHSPGCRPAAATAVVFQ